jgi:hypothetical protein
MSQCDMDFWFIPLHIVYSFQHFEPIKYVNDLFRYLLTFETDHLKVRIDLDVFPSLLKLVMRKPSIQFSQPTTSFYYNENFDFTLMDILRNYWDSQLEYVVSLFNISIIKISLESKIKIIFNIYPKKKSYQLWNFVGKICLCFSSQ